MVYDSGVRAELGNVLTPTQVQNQPTVTWPTEDGALYTLILSGESQALGIEKKNLTVHYAQAN